MSIPFCYGRGDDVPDSTAGLRFWARYVAKFPTAQFEDLGLFYLSSTYTMTRRTAGQAALSHYAPEPSVGLTYPAGRINQLRLFVGN